MSNDLSLPSPGQTAPHFSYSDPDGTPRTTQDLAGKTYIVYFYPKDDTPGCTKQACAFRDLYSEFVEHDVTVIGVSPDDTTSHDRFREKHKLPFPMASDTDREISKAYGVWGPKKFMGREYEGVHRITFLVGPDGKIIRVYRDLKPENHAPEILKDAISS